MRNLSSSENLKENNILDNFRPPCLVGKRKVAIIKDTNYIKKTSDTNESIIETNPGDKYFYNELLNYVHHPIFVPTVCTAVISTCIPIGLYLWYRK